VRPPPPPPAAPKPHLSSRQDKNAAAAPARHSDDDDDDGVDDEAAAAPLIASPRRAAAVVGSASVAANAAPPQQSPPHPHAWTLLLALVALLAIAAHSALFHPPRSEQPQQQQDPAKRFACPLATAAERDAARLASARNLTRARPWLLRPVRAAPRDAQDLFSAGLLEAHGFNAAEAAAFADLARRRAGPRDSCALCAWLGAYSLGPTPNVVVDARGSGGAGFPVFGPAEAAQADALAQRALELALEQQQKEQREHEQGDAAAASRRHRRRRRASAREERLVRALADRNRGAAALVAEAKGGEPLPEPWRPRQEAYARELASLAADVEKQEEEEEEEEDEEEGAPADAAADAAAVTPADVLALAAEAHLCLTPWDYYYYVNDGDDPGHAQPPRRLLLPSSPDGADASGRGISASVPRPGRRLRLRPMAAAAERLLRSALRFDPRHSLALHLLVHLAEAGTPGPRPAEEGRAEDSSTSTAAAQVAAWRGEPAADALAALRLPQGHLLHMPSHVYVRVGRYRDAVRSNAAARRHDVSAAAAGRCAPAYVPEHNAQLASYAAAAAGMERAALASALGARRLRSVAPDLYVARGTEWTTVPLLRARFGDWRAVLLPEAPRAARGGAAAAAGEGEGEDEDEGGEEDGDFARGPLRPPRPDARARTSAGGFAFSKVVYRYVRLLALAARAEAQGEAAAAGGGGGGADRAAVARELRALRRAARDARALREPITLPGGSPGLYASGNAQLAPIYERIGTARAEMAQAQKPGAAATISRARAALEQAAELERALPYFEPPMLEAPASACLGWLLLERADEPRAAAETFRRELAERHPENPWALGGLAAALERIRERRRSDGGASAASAEDRELADVRRRAERAWRDADPDVRARFFGPAAAGGGSSCPQFSAPWPAAPEGQKD
jgi:hypothetical protein